MEEEIEIPIDIFNEDEFLAPYERFFIENLDDIFTTIDNYKTLHTNYDYVNQTFKILIYYKIYGQTRVKVYKQVLLDEFKNIIKFEEDKYIEKYGEVEEDEWIELEDGRYADVKRYEFDMLLIRPINSWYGRGDCFELMKIIENNSYYFIFTKSNSMCLTISSIKSQEIDKINLTASELKSHTLMKNYKQKKYVINDEYLQIYKKYNKEIKIIKHESQLLKLIDKDFKEFIILFTLGQHIGCVYKNFIPKLDLENKTININVNNINLNKIHALVWMDLEFEFDDEVEICIKSKDPNLVCLIINKEDVDKIDKLVFRNVKLALNYLINLQKQGLTYVYSVNGSKIEHQFIIKSLIKDFKQGSNKKDYPINYECDNVSGTRIKTIKYGNLHFVDQSLIIPKSVEEMGKIFNTSVLKDHNEWSYLEKTKKIWNKDKNDWDYIFDKDKWYRNKKWDHKNQDDIDYCFNDCQIPMEAAFKFNKILSKLVSKIKYTFKGEPWVISQSSISSIGKSTLLDIYPKIVNSKRERAIFQCAYFGGRCEMKNQGYLKSESNKRLIGIDINGSYASQACKELPGSVLREQEDLNDLDEGDIWVSFCYITLTKKFNMPPFGIQLKSQYVFPNIKTKTLIPLWSYTYNYFKNVIKIHKVIKTYVFNKFSFEYPIRNWYKLKQEAKTRDEKEVYKIFCNGALGGLALKTIQDGRIYTNNPDFISTDKKLTMYNVSKSFDNGEINMYIITYDKLIEAKTAFQTMSAITELGRLQLREKYDELKEVGYFEWLYGDTDSFKIICDNKVADYLKETASNELGGWDYEEYEAVYFRGLKSYCLDDKVVFRGIHKKELTNLSMLNIIDDNINLNSTRWKVIDNSITIYNSQFHYENNYKKGVIKSNGKVKPILI